MQKKGINVLSLFDGMSVAQQALKNMGVRITNYYASEIDEYAIAVTQSNHPDTAFLGDVTTIVDRWCINSPFKIRDIDLLIGGSPCQDLSIAKKGREGLKGARSGLFYEYLRIRDEVKPKFFILENVASMPKEARDTISKELGVEPIMINAALVSAQNRKRLFWVGKLNEWGGYSQVDVSLPEDRNIYLKDILESDVDEKYFLSEKLTTTIRNWGDTQKNKGNSFKANIFNSDSEEKSSTLKATYHKIQGDGSYIETVLNKDGTEKLKSNTVRTSGRGSGIDDKHNWDTIRIGSLNSGGQGDRIYSADGKSVALSANSGGTGSNTGLYAVIPEATKKGYAVAQDGDSIDLSFPNSTTPRGRVGNKVKNLMTSQNIGVFTQGVIRKLTPTECLRLQSMPDDYFDNAIYKNKPISNTQRYKMCGNAFNCEVIMHILKNLK